MSSGNNVVKSFSSFSVSDGLLAKIVEAVKQGNRDAVRSGQVRSFEIFYHGLRANLVMGRIVIVPPAVADSIEDFPSALLYGAMVRETNGETFSDAYTYKLGESEFDTYSSQDMAAIKDRLFRDVNGKYRSIVIFIPTWAAPRDYVMFKFVKDDAQLCMLIRHMVFGAYFNPALSSAFDRLSNDVTEENFNVSDISPKLNFPFLAENVLKSYPNLQPGDKRAAKQERRRVFLAADTLKAVDEEVLEPGEQAVMNALGEELQSKLGGAAKTAECKASEYCPQCGSDFQHCACPNKEELAKQAAGKGTAIANKVPEGWRVAINTPGAQPKEEIINDPEMTPEALKITLEERFPGYAVTVTIPQTASVARTALGWRDPKNPLKPGERVMWRDQAHQIRGIGGTVKDGYIRWDDGQITRLSDAVNMSSVERAPATESPEGKLASEEAALHDDTGATTGLRDRPDYNESTSYCNEVNAQSEKAAAVRTAGKIGWNVWNDDGGWKWQVTSSGILGTKTIGEGEAPTEDEANDLVRKKLRAVGAAPEDVPLVRFATKEARLLTVRDRFIAVAASGYREVLHIQGRQIRWKRPNQFPLSFRQGALSAIRNPRTGGMKRAEVPQTFEEIWGAKMDDMGPAPAVEIPGENGAAGSGSAGTPEQKDRNPAPEEKSNEGGQDKKPLEKTSSLRTNPCVACTRSVTAANGSEVAPETYLHAACQKILANSAANQLTVRQVLAAFYPEILQMRRRVVASAIAEAMQKLREKGALAQGLDFSDLTPNQQAMVLDVARKLDRIPKAAAFDLFIPGQVAQEFAPETLHEIVDFPEQDYNPPITNIGPPQEGQYVSTDPGGLLGVGSMGQPQVLDGAPLRKEDDIRGYMFGQEFYEQYNGIDANGLRAASVVARVHKRADTSEYRQQFADFLKKAMGEVAAAFIAAFKVTQRPLMNQVPGTGELQLQNVEQPVLLNNYNLPNVSSRVRFLVDKLNDSDIQDAINAGWAQGAVWNEDEQGGFNYEVFVRPESLDQDTLLLRYSFVVGTKGL